jgi:hypothetical protein
MNNITLSPVATKVTPRVLVASPGVDPASFSTVRGRFWGSHLQSGVSKRCDVDSHGPQKSIILSLVATKVTLRVHVSSPELDQVLPLPTMGFLILLFLFTVMMPCMSAMQKNTSDLTSMFNPGFCANTRSPLDSDQQAQSDMEDKPPTLFFP